MPPRPSPMKLALDRQVLPTTAAALNGFAAGKTGTSQDYRDAWFIGFNDALVVGVWSGMRTTPR